MEAGEIAIESSQPKIEEPQGNKTYNIEGTNISVSYRIFNPKESGGIEDPTRGILFIPGWSIPENAKSLRPIAQEMADYSKNKTFVVDTTTEKVAGGSLAQEARALIEFVKEQGLHNLTLVGNSQGGAEAIHLVAILKEQYPEIKVDGIGLFDPVTLYEQGRRKFLTNYVKDILKTGVALTHPPQMREKDKLYNQNIKYAKDGVTGILKALIHAKVLGLPFKIWDEMSEMTKANPDLAKIDVPVVIIQGAHDKVSDPAKIIPSQGPNSATEYIEKGDKREALLKKIFPNSPYLRLIVPEKMGFHNVSYSRPEQSAHAVLYMLERYKRQQAKSAST